MLTPRATKARLLDQTAAVTVTDLYGLGRDAYDRADDAEWPNAQIIETLDKRTCLLCRRLHGMILARTDPRYQQYKHPSHINCRRIIAFIGRRELGDDGKPLKPTFKDPDPELLRKHGHFHVDPDKYAPLRIPARPEGRDFIFVPGGRGEPGKLLWRQGLSDRARRATINDMLSAILSDEATLAKSGPLIQSLITWSAETADFKDLAAAVSAARTAFPALTSDYQVLELQYRLAQAGEVYLFETNEKTQRLALYADDMQLSDGLRLEEVVLIYDPLTAQIEDIAHQPKAWLTNQQSSRILPR